MISARLMLLQVLCHIDKTDGSPSFDLNEVASQNEAQMAAVLRSVSGHLNSLDKQFHAEEADAAFGKVLQVSHAIFPSSPCGSNPIAAGPVLTCLAWDGYACTQVLQAGLIHHKQEASQMVSSALEKCRRTDAQFFSGILEACSSFRREVSSSP